MQWTLTLWSLTQRRFLRAIEDALVSANASMLRAGCRLPKPRNCATRLFVEWHLGPYNLSFIDVVAQRVRELRPDALFRSFMILKPPLEYVASNGAFWRPHLWAEDVVWLQPDSLLLELVHTTSADCECLVLPRTRAELQAAQNASAAGSGDEAEAPLPACASSLERCRRVREMEAANRNHYLLQKKGHPMSTSEGRFIRREAEKEMERTARWRAYVRTRGCDQLVTRAMHALSHVDHVMALADARTLPTVQAVALGDLSFRPRETYASDALTPPVQAATPRPRLSKFQTPSTIALALVENACSIRFFKNLSTARLP